jgi:hypothetical protein
MERLAMRLRVPISGQIKSEAATSIGRDDAPILSKSDSASPRTTTWGFAPDPVKVQEYKTQEVRR